MEAVQLEHRRCSSQAVACSTQSLVKADGDHFEHQLYSTNQQNGPFQGHKIFIKESLMRNFNFVLYRQLLIQSASDMQY